MRSTRRERVAALAVLAVCGCSSPDTTGVLGNGEFRYLCDGDVDTACSGDETDTDLPGAIAVGATFQIGYTPHSSIGYVEGDTGYEIIAASPRLASTSGDTIAALREGYVALLARHVGNATIDDFVHLRFNAIRTLVVTPSTSVTVSAGQQATLEVSALDALGAPLAGRLSCQWGVTAGAPSIALVGSPIGDSATVMTSAQGSVTGGSVHVVCGAGSVDVPITVTGVSPANGAPLDAGIPVDAAHSADDGGPLD